LSCVATMVNNALWAFEKYRPLFVGEGMTCSQCFDPCNGMVLLAIHCCAGKLPYLSHIHGFGSALKAVIGALL